MKYKSNRCMLIVALMCSVMPYATRSFEMLNEESMNDTELPHYENYEETSLYDEEESENLTTLYDTNADNDNMDQIQPVQLDNEHLDDSKRLKIYRKLFINDLEISFNGDDVDVDMDEMILKAKYKDDIQYECDLPKSEFTGTFDWSVNGRFLGNNDSSYNIIIDRRISFLNVSCYFQMVNMSKFSWINFPPLSIGKIALTFSVNRKLFD